MCCMYWIYALTVYEWAFTVCECAYANVRMCFAYSLFVLTVYSLCMSAMCIDYLLSIAYPWISYVFKLFYK